MKALYEIRNRDRKTRAEVAKEMGVSVTTVYRWESGTRQPRTNMLRKLATYFKTSIDTLLNPSDSAGPGKSPSSRGMRSATLRKSPRTNS